MKYFFYLICVLSLTVITAQSQADNVGTFPAESQSEPVSFEEELINFFEDYLFAIKTVKEEPDNNKAVEIIEDIKENFISKAEELNSSLKNFKKDLTPQMQTAFDERLKKHPIVQELFETLYHPQFLERISSHKELKLAMNGLNSINKIIAANEPSLVQQEIGWLNVKKGNLVLESHSIYGDLTEESIAVSGPDKKVLELQIQGMSGEEQVELYFTIDAEKAKTTAWTKDNTKIVITKKDKEITYIGIPKKGKVMVEQLGNPGGIVSGRFSGLVYDEEHKSKKYKISGTFKAIREGKE